MEKGKRTTISRSTRPANKKDDTKQNRSSWSTIVERGEKIIAKNGKTTIKRIGMRKGNSEINIDNQQTKKVRRNRKGGKGGKNKQMEKKKKWYEKKKYILSFFHRKQGNQINTLF